VKLSAILEALVEAGATPQMMLAAVRAHEAQTNDALERRRESDRLRQEAKRGRERNVNHVTSRDDAVTVSSRDARVVISSSSLRSEGRKALTSFEPKRDESPKPKTVKAHPLPPDWQPEESTWRYGLDLGRARQHLEGDLEEMRLWALANGGANTLKRDWNMALKGWFRRNHEKQSQHARAGPKPSSGGGFASIAAMRMREDERDFDDQIRNAGPPAEPIDIRSREPLFERFDGDQFSKMAHRG